MASVLTWVGHAEGGSLKSPPKRKSAGQPMSLCTTSQKVATRLHPSRGHNRLLRSFSGFLPAPHLGRQGSPRAYQAR